MKRATSIRSASLALLTLALLTVPPVQAQTSIQPGLWEFTLHTEFGANSPPSPDTRARHCIGADESADPRRLLLRAVNGAQCQVRDYRQQDRHASWRLVCDGKPSITGAATLDIESADAYRGSYTLELLRQDSGGAEHNRFSQTYQARRLGDCAS
jgi:hypothetical protein